MEKVILKHINKQEMPAKWAKLLKNTTSSTYRIIIEPESDDIQETNTKKSWRDMPMFGMWKDRDDMNDPINYIRKLRKARF